MNFKKTLWFYISDFKNDITSLYPRKYEGIKRLIKALLDFHG